MKLTWNDYSIITNTWKKKSCFFIIVELLAPSQTEILNKIDIALPSNLVP